WYSDADGDGHGDPANRVCADEQPEGYVADGTDCDDADSSVHDACDVVPTLEGRYTTEFVGVWWDKKSEAQQDGAFYRPKPPTVAEGELPYYVLGDYGQGDHNAPVAWSLVVRELTPGALAEPEGYEEIWNDKGSGADLDGSFWQPIAPLGYRCLGVVAQLTHNPPNRPDIRCVKNELTVPGRLGSLIWNDKGSGAKRDFAAWLVLADADGLPMNTFTAQSYDIGGGYAPPTGPFFSLRKEWVQISSDFVAGGPALEGQYTTKFEFAWSSLGGWSVYEAAFYHPIPPDDYYVLGDYGQVGYGAPVGLSLVVRELTEGSGALAEPVGYQEIWKDKGSGADLDGSFWRPIAPPGYRCLGVVAQLSHNQPNRPDIRCVREELLLPGESGSPIWRNSDYFGGERREGDFNAWQVFPGDDGIYFDIFGARNAYLPFGKSPVGPFFSLGKEWVQILSDFAGDGPALEGRYTTVFDRVWWDKKSGAQRDGAFWRPIPPAGYYVLGDYGQGNYNAPDGSSLVVRELTPGALAEPVGYQEIWKDKGSGATEDGSFWRPIAPPGYRCLGVVAQLSHNPPNRPDIRCVRTELTYPGELGIQLWNDASSGADRDFAAWLIVGDAQNGVDLNTFTAFAFARQKCEWWVIDTYCTERWGYRPPYGPVFSLGKEWVQIFP
ncbi:MAG: Vps62-related protein, partial [Anaerolineales bacterium]|nr:Vps62-related protein [Anaerolineales bacterium]